MRIFSHLITKNKQCLRFIGACVVQSATGTRAERRGLTLRSPMSSSQWHTRPHEQEGRLASNPQKTAQMTGWMDVLGIQDLRRNSIKSFLRREASCLTIASFWEAGAEGGLPPPRSPRETGTHRSAARKGLGATSVPAAGRPVLPHSSLPRDRTPPTT